MDLHRCLLWMMLFHSDDSCDVTLVSLREALNSEPKEILKPVCSLAARVSVSDMKINLQVQLHFSLRWGLSMCESGHFS